jgi:uncharacterized protein
MLPDWTSSSVATLTEADMEILTGLGTEIILLGTGSGCAFHPAPCSARLPMPG